MKNMKEYYVICRIFLSFGAQLITFFEFKKIERQN